MIGDQQFSAKQASQKQGANASKVELFTLVPPQVGFLYYNTMLRGKHVNFAVDPCFAIRSVVLAPCMFSKLFVGFWSGPHKVQLKLLKTC